MIKFRWVTKVAPNRSISAALLVASASISTAQAEATVETAQPARLVVSFDWLAGQNRHRRPAASSDSASVNPVLSLGSGTYICSPAGAGHQSRCFAR